jgi:hypothetical protein
MADYRIGIQMYQIKAGDENAKVKITINGNVVDEEYEVVGEDEANATIATFEVSGLDAPAADGSNRVVMKIELLNDLYIDEDNDRSVSVTFIGYNTKKADGKYYTADNDGGNAVEVSDWTAIASYMESHLCGVTGDDSSTLTVTVSDDGTSNGNSTQYLISTDQITITMPLVWGTVFADP